MNEKEKQIDEILKYIVNEISITSSMQEKAISSYQSILMRRSGWAWRKTTLKP